MTPEEMVEIHVRAMRHSTPWSLPTIKGFLAAPGAVVVTRAAAFALGRVIVDEAELQTVAVAPEAQGRGLGRDCLAAFEQSAAARGAARVFLEVAEANGAALNLYRSRGYIETGMRPAYYTAPDGKTHDALMMSKALVPA